jgi:hypothetical protein
MPIDPKTQQYLGCDYCIHKTGPSACEAFPGQIPMSIQMGSYDHRHPWPGDNGIRFEPKPNTKVGELNG